MSFVLRGVVVTGCFTLSVVKFSELLNGNSRIGKARSGKARSGSASLGMAGKAMRGVVGTGGDWKAPEKEWLDRHIVAVNVLVLIGGD